MPMLVQICIVIVTIALVAIVTATILTMIRHIEVASRLTIAAHASLARLDLLMRETHELMASVREIVPPTQRVVDRFQRLGERAADLSTAVFDQIEAPAYEAVAVMRGVRVGAARLIQLMNHRLSRRGSPINGDQAHE